MMQALNFPEWVPLEAVGVMVLQCAHFDWVTLKLIMGFAGVVADLLEAEADTNAVVEVSLVEAFDLAAVNLAFLAAIELFMLITCFAMLTLLMFWEVS